MKANFALLALTAGQVSAHWGAWKDAPKYTPPQAIDNKCEENQKKGWQWDDLQVGQFEKYNDFDFKGWSCGTDKSKRDLTGRHFGKSIFADCGNKKEEAPSFGCGAGKKEKSFSLHKFHVKPEFDCRLEFHYDMPDGSTCKHQADCSKDGTDIYNTQCGGAKKVHFVYPKQPNKPKDKCRVEIPQIDFNCDKPSFPKYPKPSFPPTDDKTKTIPNGDNTKTVPAGEQTTEVPSAETTSAPYGDNTETVPAGDNTETVPAGEQTTDVSSPGETTSAPVADNTESVPYGDNTKTFPAGEETTAPAENTETVPAGDNTKTVPAGEETKTVPAGEETTAPAENTETVPAGENTKTVPAGEETTAPAENTETVPAGDNTKTVPAGDKTTDVSSPAETTSAPAGEETETVPAGDNTKTVPAGEETTAPADSTETVPAGDNTKTVPAGEETTAPVEEIKTTVYDSTSTVYTTEVKTITSCGPEVTNCPVTAGTPAVVTETVAISTTICPVTETLTGEKPAHTKPAGEKPTGDKPVEGGDKPGYTAPAGDKPTGDKPAKTTEGSSPHATSDVPEEVTTIVTSYDSVSTVYKTEVKTITSCGPEVTNCPVTAGEPAVVTETHAVSTTLYPVIETVTHKAPKPVQTGSDEKPQTPEVPKDGYDVPDVVPSCLNTFLDFVEDCKDNTDAACYCPSKDFVDNVFQCLYAHAENDDTVAQAVSFFQGICAPYVEKNPGIATGADSVTEHITVTGTTIITSAHYTTVVVATTITEAYVTGGSTIEGSSTVKTIETEIVVPEVGFTSGPAGNGPVPAQTAPAEAPAAGTEAPAAPGYEVPGAGETLITNKPVVGTGGVPVPTSAPGVPVTAGAARNGMGIAAAILAVAIAL